MALGAGIPLLFFLFQLMAQVSSDLEWFKYFTVNTLFDTDAILSGEGLYPSVYNPNRCGNCPL